MTLCEYKSTDVSQVNQDKLVCYLQQNDLIYGLKRFEKRGEEKGKLHK